MPDDPLVAQCTRRRLLEAVTRRPGVTLSQLCRELSAGWGTVNYHIHLLRRAGLIVSPAIGRDRPLFPRGTAQDKIRVLSVLATGRAGEISRLIAEQPGVSQRELCERLGMTRKVARRNLDLLAHAGLIQVRREDGVHRHYPDAVLVTHLARPADAPPEARPPEPRVGVGGCPGFGLGPR